MTGDRDALDRLPADGRARLEAFARALERVNVDDLILHVSRPRASDRRRAVERAAVVARESGLEEPIDASRTALVEGIINEFASVGVRVGAFGLNPTGGMGPADDRVRILRSLGDVVTALVLWDRLDVSDRDELLGLWGRLVA